MINPVDGKVVYPNEDRMWARSINNEIKLIRITQYTCTFLDMIGSLHKAIGLKLIDMHIYPVLFPELFFENDECDAHAVVFYEDNCWNIKANQLCLNSKAMKEVVVPFLEFLDGNAVRVDYKMAKEYLGLNNKKEED